MADEEISYQFFEDLAPRGAESGNPERANVPGQNRSRANVTPSERL